MPIRSQNVFNVTMYGRCCTRSTAHSTFRVLAVAPGQRANKFFGSITRWTRKLNEAAARTRKVLCAVDLVQHLPHVVTLTVGFSPASGSVTKNVHSLNRRRNSHQL
eukprot:Pompholyxophrys_punicea_v1_NODE_301_length_2325_cov_5.422907.p3 type:complete len:106 gc:universal NODE_301_length_2325_cov_5.422907:868-1185(+)